MQKCERCGATAKGYDLVDYCAECGKNLCDGCMEKGCCGHTPARSGTEEDHGIEPMTQHGIPVQ